MLFTHAGRWLLKVFMPSVLSLMLLSSFGLVAHAERDNDRDNNSDKAENSRNNSGSDDKNDENVKLNRKNKDDKRDAKELANREEKVVRTQSVEVDERPRDKRVSKKQPKDDELSNFSSIREQMYPQRDASTQQVKKPAPPPVVPGPVVPANLFPKSVALKVLVLGTTADEPAFGAIVDSLKRIGVPYTAKLMSAEVLTAADLINSDNSGRYYGVILTNNSLAFASDAGWASALNGDEWTLLRNYEREYQVRELNYYTYPSPDLGFVTVPVPTSTDVVPLQATVTADGIQVFNYLTGPVKISNAYSYLAAAGPSLKVLVAAPDSSALVSTQLTADNREVMLMTMDGSQYLQHSNLLSYGLLDWLTKGVFIGERAVYFSPQVDDVLLDNDIWNIALLSTVYGENTYRLSASDFNAYLTWQKTVGIKTHMVFNAAGAAGEAEGAPTNDALTRAFLRNAASFHMVNHTYDHTNMNEMSYVDALAELNLNHEWAVRNNLANYEKSALVTPEISGLENPAAVQAMIDFGIKHATGNTTIAMYDNPSFNVGFSRGSMNVVPRYAANIYYNVSTDAELVSEYNFFYGVNGFCRPDAVPPACIGFGRDLSYAEIMDKESDLMLNHLLRYSLNPVMFHQANMRQFKVGESLLSRVLGDTLAKYKALYNLPIKTPSHKEIGDMMLARAAREAANPSATFVPGTGVILNAAANAVIPMTGIKFGANAQSYGTESISFINVGPSGSVTIK